MTFTHRTVAGHYIRFQYYSLTQRRIDGGPKYSYVPHVGTNGVLTTAQRNANAFVIVLQNQGYLPPNRGITIGSVQITYDAQQVDIAAGIIEDQRHAEQAKIDEVTRMRAEAEARALKISYFAVDVIEGISGEGLVKVYVTLIGETTGTLAVKWGNLGTTKYEVQAGDYNFARPMEPGTHQICADLV